MERLLKELKVFYKKNRRDLPWRPPSLRLRKGKADLYKILVSEVMLQQTQVERVVPYYKKFIKEFPTATELACAPFSQVLHIWSGLGYNRRAQFLHKAAKVLATEHAHERTVEFFEGLPGVGHYTARAVAAFAYNKPEVFIETNTRTVFMHHCFPTIYGRVSDQTILPLVAQALKQSKMQPREFYAALMDYGAYLKRSGVQLNKKSVHYAKQKKFEGSSRQLRGHLLRLLLQKPHTIATMIYHSARTAEEVRREVVKLQKEKLIVQRENKFYISH